MKLRLNPLALSVLLATVEPQNVCANQSRWSYTVVLDGGWGRGS